MRRRRPKQRLLRDLVRQRMEILYSLAVEAARRGDLDYASMLGEAILSLARETRIRPPRRIKRSLCKNCRAPLIPGVTARVRLATQGRFSYRVITCLRCGWIHRYPYKKGGSFERGAEEKGKGGAPFEPRRDNREEGGNERGTEGDRREA